jgi:hypothetical protein
MSHFTAAVITVTIFFWAVIYFSQKAQAEENAEKRRIRNIRENRQRWKRYLPNQEEVR